MAVALAAPHFPPDNSGDPRYDEEPEGGGGGKICSPNITRFRDIEVIFYV